MSVQYSADSILAEVRLRAKLPAADATWTDANLLIILNSELQSWAAPFLMKERAEFLVTFVDQTTQIGVSTYPIPPQAVGGVLRDLQALDTSNNVWQLQQIDLNELGPIYSSVAGVPSTFYVQGDQVIMTYAPSANNWRLRFYYARRPSQVVLESAVAKITAISGNIVTVAAFPAGYTLGAQMEFIHGGSSFLPYTGTFSMPTPSGSTATFASLPTGLVVGDYLCLLNQSCFPQIPADMQPTLMQRVVTTVLRAEGDDKAKDEKAAFNEMANDMKNLMAPRVQGAVKGLRGILSRGYFPGRWGF